MVIMSFPIARNYLITVALDVCRPLDGIRCTESVFSSQSRDFLRRLPCHHGLLSHLGVGISVDSGRGSYGIATEM